MDSTPLHSTPLINNLVRLRCGESGVESIWNMGGTVKTSQVRALINLVPLFGEVADNRLTKETVLEYGSEFQLNPYFDKEMFYALCQL